MEQRIKYRIINGKMPDQIILSKENVELVTDLSYFEYSDYQAYLNISGKELEIPIQKNSYHTISILLNAEKIAGISSKEQPFYVKLKKGSDQYQTTTGTIRVEKTENIQMFTVGEDQKEPFFVVDGSTRQVSIPEKLKQIGIERDHNAERVWFTAPRYFDGYDMSQCNRKYVYYQNLSDDFTVGPIGQYPIDDVTVSEENTIQFSWLISNQVTQKSGKIAFVVCFKNIDSDGTVVWEWHTQKNEDLVVGIGLDEDSEIPQQYPDLLEQWLSKMEEYEKEVLQAEEYGKEASLAADYANEQAERAKIEVDRLLGIDAVEFQSQLDAIKPNAKIRQYTSFSDLGLPNTATYQEIFNAMESPSYALLLKSTEEVPESPMSPTQPGFLVINKLSNSRSEWSFFIVGNGICEKYIGGYTTTITPNFTGWKKVISSSNVDIALNNTSEDPVQNKVIKKAIDDINLKVSEKLSSQTGTWTPKFKGATTEGGYTYGAGNTATYTKIGNMVYISGTLDITKIGTAPTGAYSIAGLPFAAAENENGNFSCYGTGGTSNSMRNLDDLRINPNAVNEIALISFTTAGRDQATPDYIPLSAGDTVNITFSGWYRTN